MRFKVTSPYGALEEIRNGRPHSGIDFKMEEGTPIHAIQDGIVQLKDFGDVNAGKTVLLKMEDGKTAIFGHLKDFAVRDGQHVNKGDLIAHSGNTGHSTGPHLHFGIKDGSTAINPVEYANDIQTMGSQKGLLSRFLENGQINQYNPSGQSLKERFIENGQVNQFEHADFSIWQDVFGIPGQDIVVFAAVVVLLLLIKPIRTYIVGLAAFVLLILGLRL